jgi:hypothetical protein
MVDSETPDKFGADKKSPWIIKTIKGEIGTPIFGQKAALVSAVNVFNETLAERDALHDAPAEAAAVAGKLERLGAAVLVVEPGVPRGGEFIACLRSSLSPLGFAPLSPCTHSADCPMPGGGRTAKWCHFAFDTLDAPESLHKLSADAGIPKERAVLSFLLADKAETLTETPPEAPPTVRIVSDSFPVPRGFGRYGCCEKGLVLVAGGKAAMERAASGVEAPLILSSPEKRDPKTNALMGEVRA